MGKKDQHKKPVTPEVDPGEETMEPVSEALDQDGRPVTGTDEDASGKTYTLSAEEFEQAKSHIETLQREKDETVQLLQRNQADFDNYRRRNATARADSYEEGRRECIKQLLPVLDNFDRALENGAEVDKAWKEGVQLVCRQLHEILEKQGLTVIPTDGKFDPNLHEAVMQEKVEGRESGEILQVLQKGYRVGERIIRHSVVKVAE